jgi:carboxylesterase
MQSSAQVIAGAEAFELGGGPVGALLIHGYTGSPQGLRGLGEHLADRGLTVKAPRLPGHGTSWQDLDSYRYPDWVAEVERAYGELQQATSEVFLVGLSFGAALGLNLVQRRPGEIKGLVTIAGLVKTFDPRRPLAGVISRLVRSLPGVSNDIADPDMREIAYDRLPARATYSMVRFLDVVRARLSEIDVPLLVIHSHNDHTVDPRNAQLIFDGVASVDKALEWFDLGYHVLTLDLERERIFERVYSFIKERSDVL